MSKKIGSSGCLWIKWEELIGKRYGRTVWGDTNILSLDKSMVYIGISISQIIQLRLVHFNICKSNLKVTV